MVEFSFLIFRLLNKNQSNTAVEISIGSERSGFNLINDSSWGVFNLKRAPYLLNRSEIEHVGRRVIGFCFDENMWIVDNKLKDAEAITLEMLEDSNCLSMRCMDKGLLGEVVQTIPVSHSSYREYLTDYEMHMQLGHLVLKYLPAYSEAFDYDRDLENLPEPDLAPQQIVSIRLNDRINAPSLYIEGQDYVTSQNWDAYFMFDLPSLDGQDLLADEEFCYQLGRKIYWRVLHCWRMRNDHWPLFNLFCFVSLHDEVPTLFIREGDHQADLVTDVHDIMPLNSIFFDEELDKAKGYNASYDHLAKTVIKNLSFTQIDHS